MTNSRKGKTDSNKKSDEYARFAAQSKADDAVATAEGYADGVGTATLTAAKAYADSIKPLPANPSAVASDVAVNGVATTFMRSDAASAIQKGSASQFGLLKVDGLTITTIGGVASAVSGGQAAAMMAASLRF